MGPDRHWTTGTTPFIHTLAEAEIPGLGAKRSSLRPPALHKKVRRGSRGECRERGGGCPSDRQEARRREVQPEARGFGATGAAKGPIGSRPRGGPAAAPGRPPVPTHGLGQSLTVGETTDSRRLRQRRGLGSSAGSRSCSRGAWSIPTPPSPSRPAPRTLRPQLTPPPPPRPRRASAKRREGTTGSARARARTVATAAHHLRLPLMAQARGGARRGRARRQGRDRTQKVWPRLGPAHPRGRRPSGLGRSVSRAFQLTDCLFVKYHR
ncbi:uncharacterized protein [Alexandromys fortis]|uniref:uncharacterized protein n=1 Tax=Alexandromys fortis TaxID=100897 RepID=UPI002153655C|nr:uncharacterized protein LOC126505435 [Microtus fortis]